MMKKMDTPPGRTAQSRIAMPTTSQALVEEPLAADDGPSRNE